MASILLHHRCPPQDDPDVTLLLELVRSLTGAEWVELRMTPDSGQEQRYSIGNRGGRRLTVPLDLPSFSASVHLGGVSSVDECHSAIFNFALRQIVLCRRFLQQTSLLKGALDTTTSAVLLFDGAGDIAYANPTADLLLSRQTEDDLEVESSGQRSQPMFMRIWSMVEKVLDGRVTKLPWTTALVMADASVLACEIMRAHVGDSQDDVGILVFLQSLPALPRLFLESFCARHGISPREQQVIGLLLEGLGTADMAHRLSISEHTVRDHLKRLYRKTGTRSRSELMSTLSSARMEPANGGKSSAARSFEG